MAKLERKYGTELLRIGVSGVILSKMELFNVKLQMSNSQVKFFSEAFVKEYKLESVADLSVCLNNAAMGRYGAIYNAIDPPTIFGWMSKHLEEKYQEKENEVNRTKERGILENDYFRNGLKKLKVFDKRKPEEKKTRAHEAWWAEMEKKIPYMSKKALLSWVKEFKNSSGFGGFNNELRTFEEKIVTNAAKRLKK